MDWQELLMDALKSGVSVTEFWEQTPRETWAAIEAAVWREEQAQERDIAMAWLTAKLMRAKKIPSLQSVLGQRKPARPLRGEERLRRRDEFKSLTAPDKLAAINAHAQRLHAAGKLKTG